MIKYVSVLLIAVGLVVSVVWLSPTLFRDKTSESVVLATPIPKMIKYRLEVSNPANSLLKKPSVFVGLPFDSEHQKITDLSVSLPYKKVIDSTGNISLELNIETIAPYETKIIDITAKLNIYSGFNEVTEKDLKPYLISERFIESDSEVIQRHAKKFVSGSTTDKAKNIFNFVVSTLSDSGFIEEDRGALYALKHKKADCTGYMYLYGALLRANKIPARMMSGFIVETNKKLNIKDYHNWVEVYLDGAWRIVDPQNKKFLEDESHYIAMRVINNSAKSNIFDNSQQLFKADSAVKIVMR